MKNFLNDTNSLKLFLNNLKNISNKSYTDQSQGDNTRTKNRRFRYSNGNVKNSENNFFDGNLNETNLSLNEEEITDKRVRKEKNYNSFIDYTKKNHIRKIKQYRKSSKDLINDKLILSKMKNFKKDELTNDHIFYYDNERILISQSLLENYPDDFDRIIIQKSRLDYDIINDLST